MNIHICNKKYNLSITNSDDILSRKLLTPECQRVLDKEHFSELLKYQKEYYIKYGEFFFTNPITLCKLDNKEYIIDGQHRLACIEKLRDDKYPIFNIFLITINVDDQSELEEKYISINKNNPVQLFSDIKVYKVFYKKIEEYIKDNYEIYIKNTDNPRSPNINIKHLLQYLEDSKYAVKINYNYKLFIDEFKKLDIFYKKNTEILYMVFKENIHNKIKELESKDNYTFLFLFTKFEWVDRIMYVIENKIEYKDISHYPINYRVKIKKLLRKEVWKKRNNKINGKCYCCSKNIEYDDFECGHIQSVYFKGETTLSNLEPICSICNNNMGIQNLIHYKNELLNEMK